MKKLNAQDIAWHIRCYAMQKQHEWITPNAMLYAWESDLLTVTRSNLVHEFEIKCTRSDLMRDMAKPKHANGVLITGAFPQRKYDARGAVVCYNISESKELDRRDAGEIQCRRPNYFSFAMPCHIYRKLAPGTLPPYAGVYTIDEEGRICEERSPKRLHTEPIRNEDLHNLARRIHYRYWNELRAVKHAPIPTT